jgi:ferredoxin
MPKIQAETANGLVETEAPAGKKLVLAIEDAGIDILHRCGGNARCTTSRVSLGKWASSNETASRRKLSLGRTSACRARFESMVI